MQAWKKVWRKGIAPLLPTSGLAALLKALKADDPRLLQGATTSPPPLETVQDWPIEAGDAIVFCFVAHRGGFGDKPRMIDCEVGKAEEFFARVCFEADQVLGEPAACRWFLNWFDETPRDEMRRYLIPEVERVLAFRAACDRFGFDYNTPVEIVTDRLEDEGDVLALNEVEAGADSA